MSGLADILAGDVVEAAPGLLGCVLVGRGAAGVIVETEAYHQREAACHGHGGVPTTRTEHLFGPPGTHYVYFTYGMHWCTNIVCEPEGVAAAALIRALQPITGLDEMRERRSAARRVGAAPVRDRELCAGPARLVQALDVRAEDSGKPALAAWPAGDSREAVAALALTTDLPQLLPRNDELLDGLGLDPLDVVAGPRIGISTATDLPWRFTVAGSRWLSRRH